MTLRIGVLTYDFYPFIGGQGRVTFDLFQRLRDRKGVEVEVWSPATNDVPGHHRVAATSQRFGRHPWFSLVASARTERWIRDRALDVLHVNGGPGGVLLLRRQPVPVVYSLYHTYEQVARLMPGHRWKTPATRLERRAYDHATTIVSSTESSASSLRDGIRVTPPVQVIPCGVDFDAFPRTGAERDHHTVLYVGRLDNRKNPGAAVEAFSYVARRHAEARLIVVGTGPLERALHEQVDRHGLRGRVSFERFVSHETLVDWYARAAVVVVPSLFEGFGLSAIEAQACGACVVATDSEGLRDVIIDNETGILTQPHPESLAGAITALLGDDRRRTALGEAAGRHVREVYDWVAVTERMVAVYEHAAQAGRP